MTAQPTIVNTRAALRLAILDAVRQEAEPLFVALATPGGTATEVISRGTLAEALERVKASPLPAIDVQSAEVKTPADVYVDAICPECNLPTRIQVQLSSVLETTREAGSTIKLKAKAKGKTHVHNQLSLEVDSDQGELGLEDVGEEPDDDEDLRPTGEVNADELKGAAERSVAEAERRPVRLRSVPGKAAPAPIDDVDDALLPS